MPVCGLYNILFPLLCVHVDCWSGLYSYVDCYSVALAAATTMLIPYMAEA